MTFPSTEIAPRIVIPETDTIGDWIVQRQAYAGVVFVSHSSKRVSVSHMLTPNEAVQLAQALLKQAQALANEA